MITKFCFYTRRFWNLSVMKIIILGKINSLLHEFLRVEKNMYG